MGNLENVNVLLGTMDWVLYVVNASENDVKTFECRVWYDLNGIALVFR